MYDKNTYYAYIIVIINYDLLCVWKKRTKTHAAHAVQDRRIDGRERVYSGRCGIFSWKRCRRVSWLKSAFSVAQHRVTFVFILERADRCAYIYALYTIVAATSCAPPWRRYVAPFLVKSPLPWKRFAREQMTNHHPTSKSVIIHYYSFRHIKKKKKIKK